MLRVTIELVPHGVESLAKTIHVAEIWNDSSGDLFTGNYGAKLYKRNSRKAVWKTVRVEGFKRKRLLVWDLLYRVLRAAVGDRNDA